MNSVYINAVGVAAPGLPDWQSARPILSGQAPYRPEALAAYRPTLLPRNEARRAGASVRIALQAAEQVCDLIEARGYATVFASADGDLGISDRICTALTTPERGVSPTQFHNSVHNAAAGYWSIATGARGPANSVAGGADSFAVALREAWATLSMDGLPVLLVAFDSAGQTRLDRARSPLHSSFALAMALSFEPDHALARLDAPALTGRRPTAMTDPDLETLRRQNPAARGLPLLAALARDASGCVIESDQGNLELALTQPA